MTCVRGPVNQDLTNSFSYSLEDALPCCFPSLTFLPPFSHPPPAPTQVYVLSLKVLLIQVGEFVRRKPAFPLWDLRHKITP